MTLVRTLPDPTRMRMPGVGPWLGIAILVSYGFAIPSIARVGSSSTQIGFALGSVTVAGLAALIVYQRYTGYRWLDLWMTPPGLLWLMVLVIYSVATVQWLPATTSSPYFGPEFVAQAVLAVSTMTWASLFGFMVVARRQREPKPLGRFVGLRERFKGTGVFAFAVGIVATAILIAMNRYSFIGDPQAALSETSSLTNVLTLLTSGMMYGAVVVLWNGLAGRSPRTAALGYGMFAVVGALGVVSGFKGPAITAGLAAVAVVRIAYGRYPRFLLIAIVVGVMILFPLNSIYRNQVRGNRAPTSEALSIALSRAVSITLDDPIAVIGGTTDRIISRFRLVDSTAVIIARTPEAAPFDSPLGIPIEAAAGLIPRVLWPSKPVSDSGYVFGQEYFGLSPGAYTSIAPTLPGSFYRYGGLVAVLLGGLALGMYVAVLDRIANPMRAPAGMFLFLAIARPLSALEAALVPLIAGQVQNGVVAWLALTLMVKRRD